MNPKFLEPDAPVEQIKKQLFLVSHFLPSYSEDQSDHRVRSLEG